MSESAQERRVLRRKELARQIGISPITLDRWVKAGRFPKPVHLGPGSIAWLVAEIDEWLSAKAKERA